MELKLEWPEEEMMETTFLKQNKNVQRNDRQYDDDLYFEELLHLLQLQEAKSKDDIHY